MDELRMAVIGVGIMGARHAEVLHRLPRVRLAAVMDTEWARAQAVGESCGAPAYDRLDQMLDQTELDAVCVCTPDWFHREPVLAALARGLHVLVEKPLAIALEDADAMVAAAHGSELILMVGHILRFDGRYAAAQAAVAAGDLGELTYLYGRRHNSIRSARRFHGRTSVVHFLGAHDLDMMLWCAGSRVTRVQAVGGRKALADLGVDDGVFALLEFESGAVGCLDVHWAMPPGALGLDAQFKLIGAQGQAVVDGSFAAVEVSRGEHVRHDDSVYSPSSPWLYGALGSQDAHFVECVRAGCAPLIDGAAGRRVVALAEAIHGALVERREIALDPPV